MTVMEVLSQETTLKVFLYLKTSKAREFGIRQTQNELEFKSPNSVTWHFNKLIDAGLLKKTAQNTYYLTKESESIKNFEIPNTMSVRMAGSYLLPNFAFLLSFLITVILVSLVIFIFVREPLFLAFTGITVSLITLIIVLIQFLSFRKHLRKFYLN